MIAATVIPARFATISFILKYPFFPLLSLSSFSKPALKLKLDDRGKASFSPLLNLFTSTYWQPSDIRQLYEKCCSLSIANHLSGLFAFLIESSFSLENINEDLSFSS